MGKSAKKKRQAAKRRKELDKLRGVSLLDSTSPQRGFDASPNPENASHLKNYGQVEHGSPSKGSNGNSTKENKKGIGSETLARKRVDFVLPRAMGKAETYIFDKQSRPHTNEYLPTIPEETTAEKTTEKKANRRKETLDDIFSSKKRQRLADKFEAIHQGDKAQKDREDAAARAPKKKKKKRSSSVGSQDSNSNRKDQSKVAEPETRAPREVDDSVSSQMAVVHQQLSGRSVEEAVKDKTGLRPRANSTDGELNLPQRGLCDEQMVLRAHRWEDERSYVHQVMPRGLVNVGNTCFLNSILQCLAYLPPFCQSLIHISQSKIGQGKGLKKKLSQGQKITSSLCNLFQRVHGFNTDSLDETSIAPHAIVKALPSIGSCGSRNGYKFHPGRQEDAHEFLVHLLDAMHDGELRAAGINQHVSGWRDRLPVTRLDETTFIHRILGGYFRSQVRCSKCGYRSNTYDPFLDLSLEVSKKSSNSVLFAISEFTRKERLDADNQWKCSGCKKYVCPTKQLTVFRPPLSLCIQLKRFTFDGSFSGRAFSPFGGGGSWKFGNNNFQGGSKITKPIQFPADLDLPLSDGRSCAYALTGVVIHVGGSASSGHYTAYVKKPSRKGKFQWYHADDSFIEPVSEKTVLKQKDAYILFYCRKEVKLEFPEPPTRDMSAEEAREFGRARARARADSGTTLDSHEQSTMAAKQAARATTKLDTLRPGGIPESTAKTTKAAIHPLAQFFNATMSEHFKTSMTPVAKRKQKRKKSRSDESYSDSGDESSQSESDTDIDATPNNRTLGIVSRGQGLMRERTDAIPDEGQKNHISGRDRASSESDSDGDSSSDDLSERKIGTAQPKASIPTPNAVSTKLNAVPEESRVKMPESKSARTRVVVGNSDSRGKVKVMMGPRKRKAWMSKTAATTKKESGFQLLGNLGVSRWDEEEAKDDGVAPRLGGVETALDTRGKIVNTIEKQEKARKRKMHLDRWDSLLDQGKVRPCLVICVILSRTSN